MEKIILILNHLKKLFQKPGKEYLSTISHLLRAHPGPFMLTVVLSLLIQAYFVDFTKWVMENYVCNLISCGKISNVKDFRQISNGVINFMTYILLFLKGLYSSYLCAIILNSIRKYVEGNIPQKVGNLGFRFEEMDKKFFLFLALTFIACFLGYVKYYEKTLDLLISIYPIAKQAYGSVVDFLIIPFTLYVIFLKLVAYLPLFYHKLYDSKDGLSLLNKAKFISIYCKWKLLLLFFLFIGMGFLVYQLPKADYYGDIVFYFGVFPFLSLAFSHLMKEIWDDKILSVILRPSESELMKKNKTEENVDDFK